MTALSADKKLQWSKGELSYVPLAADAVVYLGAMVCVNAAGYGVAAADTAGLIFVGFATEHKDNTGGSAGDVSVQVRRKGLFRVACSGYAQSNVGDTAYVSDDQTIKGSGDVVCGVVARFISATEVEIDPEPAIELGDVAVNSFVMTFFWPGAVGAVGVKAAQDLELPRAFTINAIFADAKTAPGAGYNCTVTVTQGATTAAVTIAEAATHGEDKDVATAFAADTDFDIDLVDDDASGSTEDVMVTIHATWN